jgi:hypothetical protein
MAGQDTLSVAEFFALGNAAAAHTADQRVRMAKAGVPEPVAGTRSGDTPA